MNILIFNNLRKLLYNSYAKRNVLTYSKQIILANEYTFSRNFSFCNCFENKQTISLVYFL